MNLHTAHCTLAIHPDSCPAPSIRVDANGRGWKWLGPLAALVLMLAGFSSCRSAPPLPAPVVAAKNLTMTKDVAWAKVMKFLTVRGISPSLADKDKGLITASGDTTRGEIVDGGGKKGTFVDCHYTLSISVDSFVENESSIAVRLVGEVTQLRNRHIVFITISTVKTVMPCVSTGAFERDLFAYLQ